jgi:hypothetical protein
MERQSMAVHASRAVRNDWNAALHSIGPLAGAARDPRIDSLDWPSPVPASAEDHTGTTWLIQRAWPDEAPGAFVLEVLTPGQPGVRGGHLRHGHFELVPLDDPGMPALRGAVQQGVLISYWPYRQAVVRAEGRYIKVFEPGGGVVPAQRCAQMDVLLEAGNFTTPRILHEGSQDVIVSSAIAGRTLNELGREEAAVSDEMFARAWEKWSRAWVAELTGFYGPAAQSILENLPLRSPGWEATKMWRRVDDWLRHNENLPELSSQRDALRAAAEQVATNLLRTVPDPLVWSHGDLYDKQIIIPDSDAPPGLLDFDSTARSEAARDLAGVDVRLELHLRHNRMTPARYRTAHTQVLAAAEKLHVSPGRFEAYSDAFWFRLALSPLPGRFSMAIAVLGERSARRS